jgi:urocanate hydratase
VAVAGARQAKALASTISLLGLVLLLSACGSPIQITPAQAQAAPGTSLQLTATQIDYFGSSRDVTSQVAWSSSDSAVAMVSSSGGTTGKVSALSGGSTVITASLRGSKGSMKFTVTSAVLKSIEVTPAAPSLPNGLTEQFTATGIYSDNSTQDLTQQLTWASSSPAVATISNTGASSGLATAATVGTTTISASSGTITGSTTLTVTSATLVSIEVTPATLSIPKGVNRQFTATGIFSDNSTQNLTAQVNWTSSNNSIAAVSNAAGSQGLASSVAAGSTTISATSGSISGSTSLTVTSATLVSIAVTPATPSIANGLGEQFTATGTYTDNTTQNLTTQVIWASSDTSTANVSNAAGSQGLASSAAPGSTVISAASGQISGSSTLTVTSATLVSIAVTPANPSIADGLSEQFTATGTYTDNSTQNLTTQVTWASSNTSVSTISNAGGSQGLASSAAAGNTTISAVSGAISGSTTLTVTSATLVSITVTPSNPSIAAGLSEQFTATGTYTDNSTQNLTTQVTWASSNTSVSTISNAGGSQGLASAAAAGSTTISATSGAISGNTTLTVTSASLVSITVTPANPIIADGLREQFTAIGTYTDNSTQNITTQVNWSSSNTNVASVGGSSQGLAAAANAGSTTISATSGSISGSTSLTVTSATLVSIAVTPATPNIAEGLSEQFTATGTYSDNSTQNLTTQVTWVSSNTSISTISNAAGSQGLASSAAAGSTTISATSGAISGSTTLTVTSATLVSIAITPANPSIAMGLTEQFTAIGTYTDNSTQNLTTQVTWASSNTSVSTISNAAGSQGLASSTAAGSTTISATIGSISGSTSLRVTSASLVSIAVTPANPNIAKRLTAQFTATGTYTDNSIQNLTTQVTWASSNTSVSTISNAGGSQGLASAAAAGSTTISATSGAISGSTTLTVTSAPLVSITVTPANPSIVNGLTEQFTATGTYTDNSTQNLTTQVTWASSSTGIATISNAGGSQGLATSASAGSTTISATSGAISGSTGLTVTAAMYSIGGTLSGLSANGLALTDNGGNTLSVNSGTTSFTFSTQIAYGSPYAVAVSTQPTGELCTVSNGSGTVTGTVTNVSISCVVSYTIGGAISGLNVSSVVLANAGATVAVSSGSSTWSFPISFATGSNYSVTVQTQPAGETCQITSGGSGTLSANVNSVTVACAPGLWTWEGGSQSAGASGVYGTKGTGSTSNIPPGRQNAATWTDASGNLWLFGGAGANYFNDLWEYSPSSGAWTWVSGSNGVNANGTYGTLGTPAPGNVPGGRQRAASWTDSAGNFWLFGGIGYAASGGAFYLNDLWEYSPSSGEWTWVSGSNSTGASGTFGTKGTASASNVPPANGGPAAYWIDSSNNLWLLGGSNGSGIMNALWEYSPSSGEWTWVSGSSSYNVNGVYGTQGIASSSNVLGARFLSAFWNDASGDLWLFGGAGYGASGSQGDLNDLWKYTPSNGNWTWMSGSTTTAANGVYGTEGVASAGNAPGGRFSPASGIDTSGNFWFFGGSGIDSSGNGGFNNDLWKFSPGSGEWTWMSGSTTIKATGVYGTLGAASPNNVPGARQGPNTWVDSSGNLWMFGGGGYGSSGASTGGLNDLWRFTPPL